MYGLIIILSSAAKITHQAQALTGQTTKWHACCTIEPVPDDEIDPGSNQNSMLEEYPEDESDCESSEETGGGHAREHQVPPASHARDLLPEEAGTRYV